MLARAAVLDRVGHELAEQQRQAVTDRVRGDPPPRKGWIAEPGPPRACLREPRRRPSSFPWCWRVLHVEGPFLGPPSTSGPDPQSGAVPNPAAAGHTATLDAAPAPWRSGYAAACKAVDTGSIPVGASTGFAGRPMTPWNVRSVGTPNRTPSTAVASWSKSGVAQVRFGGAEAGVTEQVLGHANVPEAARRDQRRRGASCVASPARGFLHVPLVARRVARAPVQTSACGDSPGVRG